MPLWRICKARHAGTAFSGDAFSGDAFSGEAAVLYPGRWHHAGTPVVYCSESLALAALEQLVHLPQGRLPPHFVCFRIEVPPEVAVAEVSITDLPASWRRQPPPIALRDVGTGWTEARESVVLRVPSAIVPAEHNYLLNPRHADFARLEIGDPEHRLISVGCIGAA